MSLSSAVISAVGVGLPPSGRLRAAYLAVWELGELQGKGARRGSREVVPVLEDSSLRHNGGQRAGLVAFCEQ